MVTQAEEKKIRLAGTELVIRELSIRKFQRLIEVVGSLTKHAGIFKLLESEETAAVARGVAELVRLVPDSLSEIIELAVEAQPRPRFSLRARPIKNLVLDSTPTELMSALLEIWKMNNVVDLFRKKAGPLLPGLQPEKQGLSPKK